MVSLDNAIIGEKVTVRKIHCSKVLKCRLMDMGITCGTEVCIEKCAPLGDPIQVNVRGYSLSLRKSDAESIEIDTKVCQ